MSYFYGIVNGRARTSATRTGSKGSGIETIIQSNHAGIRAYATHTRENADVFTVAMTGGRYGTSYRILGRLVHNADSSYPLQWHTGVDPETSELKIKIEELKNALSISINALKDSRPPADTAWLESVLNSI